MVWTWRYKWIATNETVDRNVLFVERNLWKTYFFSLYRPHKWTKSKKHSKFSSSRFLFDFENLTNWFQLILRRKWWRWSRRFEGRFGNCIDELDGVRCNTCVRIILFRVYQGDHEAVRWFVVNAPFGQNEINEFLQQRSALGYFRVAVKFMFEMMIEYAWKPFFHHEFDRGIRLRVFQRLQHRFQCLFTSPPDYGLFRAEIDIVLHLSIRITVTIQFLQICEENEQMTLLFIIAIVMSSCKKINNGRETHNCKRNRTVPPESTATSIAAWMQDVCHRHRTKVHGLQPGWRSEK